MNRDSFLFEATRLLFSSLQPEIALWEFYSFLKTALPLHEFNLRRTDLSFEHAWHIATVTEQGVLYPWKRRTVTAAQRRLWEEMARDFPPYGPREEMIVSEEDWVYKYYRTGLFDPHKPAIRLPAFYLRLVRDEEHFGSALFQVHRVLSEDEQSLLRALEGPLCSAINNMIQFYELSQLKEQLLQDNERLNRKLSGLMQVEVIGQKGGLKGIMRKVKMIAPVDVPVLINGETGTGKEVIAKAIHELSPRHNQPFVAVNCGAIPATLIDSELFGHVKGAFTGANTEHKGRFERAHGGTLLLDEVGELPMEVQARLLRVLETGEVERVGASSPIPVNIRLLAATHRDLARMVKQGTFREDLYYRLRVVNIQVPPLRRRKEDIPELVHFLLRRGASRYGMALPLVAEGEMERLRQYDWPGNVRELRNVVEEALVCSHGHPLHFSFGPAGQPEEDVPRPERRKEDETVPSMDELLHAYLIRCLKRCHGRVEGAGGAARLAGLTPGTFRFKCRKLGIVPRQIV